MKKVLITGSSGFLGSNLRESLQAMGGVVMTFNGEDSLNDLYGLSGIDVIFHCAAELRDEYEMFASNVALTYELLGMFREGLAKKFVYIGTSSEYGRKSEAICESDCMRPETLYEATKGCGSLLCQAFGKITNKPVMIARPFSLYGPHQPVSKFIPTLYDCYKNKKVARVDIYAAHDWVYIEDFIRGLLMMSDRGVSDTLNFGTGVQVTNGTVLEAFCDIVDYKIDLEIVENLRPYDSRNWVCDTTKAEKTLGFVCKYGIHEGLEKYIKFMEERTNG